MSRAMFLAGLVALGCADEQAGGAGFEGAGGGAPADAGGADAGGEAGTRGLDEGALAGVWAHRQITVALADVPVVGVLQSPTIATQRVVFEARDGQLFMRGLTCGLEVGSPESPVKTVVPEAFIRAVGEVVRPVVVGADGAFEAPRMLDVRGVELTDPEGEALPTEPDDPRVRDDDRDGKPGLTIRATGLTDGEIYVVQRGWTRLIGRVEGDRVDGRIEWASDQVVLDADNPILAQGVPTAQDPDPALHVFRSTRVDAARDCAWINANAAELFAR